MIPSELIRLDEARARYGDLVDRYAHFFFEGDAPADRAAEDLAALGPGHGRRLLSSAIERGIETVPEAPESLVRLFEHAERVPEWVDWRRYALGARTFQRAGVAANIVLSCVSLMTAYKSSVANKPLVFTGQLERMAQRRLAETGRFVIGVCQAGALRRDRPGWALALRVRVMHAEVRRMLSRSPRWHAEAWGAPINQANLAGTTLLFSHALCRGLRQLGMSISAEEGDALMHVWRYAGYLQGVNPELLFDRERDADWLWELGELIQPGADEGGRALAQALSRVPEQHARNRVERAVGRAMVGYMDGITRALNGDAFADDLHIGHAALKHAIVPTRLVVGALERLRLAVPFGTELAARGGNWAMHYGVGAQLRGHEPEYRAPSAIDERRVGPRSRATAAA